MYEDFRKILKFFALVVILYTEATNLIQLQYFVLIYLVYDIAMLVAMNPFHSECTAHVFIHMYSNVLCVFLLFLYFRFIPEQNNKVGEAGYNYWNTRNITEMTQLTTHGDEPYVSVNNVIKLDMTDETSREIAYL